METRGQEVHIETDEARGGSTPNVVRWVLVFGLLLAVVAMSLAWIIPALSDDEPTQNVNVSREITGNANDGESTDSIVGENADRIEGAVPAAPAETTTEGGVPTVENQPATQ